MTYELCEQLKDAGFISAGNAGSFEVDGEIVQIPTLSELIEACGNGFEELQRNNYWGKTPEDNPRYLIPKHSIVEKTPEEAVARLWIALNQRPQDAVT
jgi:hypothetical protein